MSITLDHLHTMAARKSCTHLTWSEAKSRAGDGEGIKKKKGEKPKKLTHVEKIIAKTIGGSGDAKDQQAARKKERRLEEKLAAIAAKREEERKLQREEQLRLNTISPYEQARQRMRDMASVLTAPDEESPFSSGVSSLDPNQPSQPPSTAGCILTQFNARDLDVLEMQMIAQCKEMQLSEVMALEAIFADTENYLPCCWNNGSSDRTSTSISSSMTLEELIELYQDDDENEDNLRSIAQHTPISFLLQVEVEDVEDILKLQQNQANQYELNETDADPDDQQQQQPPQGAICLLLRVTLPPKYPLVVVDDYPATGSDRSNKVDSSSLSIPRFEILYFFAADKNLKVAADKPVESLAHLRANDLLCALSEQAAQILPDLVVYEVANTWLTEHVFEFVEK